MNNIFQAPAVEKAQIAADKLRMNKGEEIMLSKSAALPHKVRVGFGWDAPEKVEGYDVDIDSSAFLIGREGRVRRDTDFVFYNNMDAGYGLLHGGDSRTEKIEGDKEVIHLNLETMPFDADKIVFTLTIHNAEEREQSWNIVKSAYIRIVDDEEIELARFEWQNGMEAGNALIIGEMSREGMGWKLKAIGTTSNGGLYKMAHDFGVNIAPL